MPRIFIAGPVSWNLLVYTRELPRAEPHTVFAERHHETIGGTSGGKALNLRRLGADVTLSTLAGDDAAGEHLLQYLRSAGVEVLALHSANGSERHVNIMDAHGRRVSIYLNLPVPADDPPLTGLEAADVVVADLAEHSKRFLPVARDLGKPIWCDLHDYDGAGSFHAPFLEAADVVFVSDERLADPAAFLHSMIAAGKRLAVCTRGADGAMALDSSGTLVTVPAVRVPEVVDTNGAGDAFFSGFLMAHLTGASTRDCLTAGASVAALCVQSPDLVAI